MRKHLRIGARVAAAVLTMLLTSMALVSIPATANAAPVRSNSQTEPVYFVHGIDFIGDPDSDCSGTWGAAINKFRALGWSGSLYTVGFYSGDRNCSITIARTSQNTSLEELGRLLAWDIYNRHSRYGRSVDLVAHSMGGLIIRAAVTGTSKHLSGWPPYIYVEDGITLSAPHNGTSLAYGCGWYQCVQLRPGSDFLRWLVPNAQASGGTDWTYVGAEDDDTVPVASATIESRAGHYIWYKSGQGGLEHAQITGTVSGTYRMQWWNYQDPKWYYTTAGQPPIEIARNAAYYWKDR